MAAPGEGTTGAGESKEPENDTRSAWGEDVASVFRTWMRLAKPLVESLHRRKALEEKQLWAQAEGARDKPFSEHGHDAAAISGGDSFVNDADRVVAALSFLGGQFEGLHPGTKVFCPMPLANAPTSTRGRDSQGASFFERGRVWEDGEANEEATVLRFRLSPPNPRNVAREGEPSVPSPRFGAGSSLRDSSVDGGLVGYPLEAAVMRNEMQETRQMFASRLMPRAPMRPLDVYDGLVDEGRTPVSTAAVAREIVRDSQNQQRLQQHQEEDINFPAPRFTVRLDGVFRGQSRGWRDLRRGLALNETTEDVGLQPRAGSGMATDSAEVGVAVFSTPPRATVCGGCDEWVTVGSVQEGRGGSALAATVPIESVAPVRTVLSRAITARLMPHVAEVMPHLTALLEAETVFRGAL